MNFSILTDYEIDYKAGMARCLNDPVFYERLLNSFLKDTTFTSAKEAFEKKDFNLCFECTHEMKGFCGNIGITELYHAASDIVEVLRHRNNELQNLTELFATMESVYYRSYEGITKALQE